MNEYACFTAVWVLSVKGKLHAMIVFILSLTFISFFMFGNVSTDDFDLLRRYKKGKFVIKVESSGKKSSGRLHLRGFPHGIKQLSYELQATSGDGIVLNVVNVKLSQFCSSFLEIWGSNVRARICQTTVHDFETDAFSFQEKNVSFRIVRQHLTSYPRCELRFTVFTKAPCKSGAFNCQNGICVWEHLVCDGINNCGDYSDEVDNKTGFSCAPEKFWSVKGTLITVAAVLVPISMMVLCLILACFSRYY